MANVVCPVNNRQQTPAIIGLKLFSQCIKSPTSIEVIIIKGIVQVRRFFFKKIVTDVKDYLWSRAPKQHHHVLHNKDDKIN